MDVVDSSGWLECFAEGPNADFFARAIEKTDEPVVPTVSLYEVFQRVLQQRGEGDALQAIAIVRQGRVIELSEAIALAAARVSAEVGLPMADSTMLASSNACAATFRTQDADFEGVSGVRDAPQRGD